MSIPPQSLDRAIDDTFAERHDQRPTGQSTLDRVPPHDLVAERGALGGMMLSKDAIGDVIETGLKPGDYYRPAHSLIHAAILDLYTRGEPVDAITVTGELTRRGEIGQIGGPDYIHQCVRASEFAASAASYAEIVRERAVFRRLGETGVRIANMGFAGVGDASEVVDTAQSELFGVLQERAGEEVLPLGATALSLADRIEERKNRKGGLRGLPTGFKDLDSLTNGLMGGQFVIIAARPAMGKSTIAVDMARNCAIKHKIPTALFSLEMGRQEIEERIMSAQARIPHHHIKSGEMTEDDWARFARVFPDYSAAPLYIDDSEHLTVMDISAKARRLKQQKDLGLVIIDYIQLMKSGGRQAESRQQEVSDISRSLKLLAKQLNVPVIGLSQLNRGPEQRTDKRPVVSDLRESGALEQDADIVVLLHREDAYEKDSPRAGEADLIVAKHRGGATATITVAFQGHYSRFVDMAN
ncbi:replicative DNA helicase [Streptomyces sp. NPDC001380]|uniref:replicative DNA helicase n=1 Tax=Streptomyces sp. NPDC001380 TaxID=3364566 RepID=UPI0036AB3797